MPIDQSITAFPPAPDSATDTPQVFNTKANTFVDHQSGVYVGEVNQWAIEANQLATQVNDDEVSAGNSATQAELDKWNTEAEKLTTQSYANLFVDTNPANTANYVVVYTSNGDGTFTQTPQTGVYSSRWWTEFNEGESAASKLPKDGSEPMTGNLEAPSMSIGGEYLTPYTMRNKLINGGFDIWQRATNATGSGYKTADRWFIDGVNTFSQKSNYNYRNHLDIRVIDPYSGCGQRIEDGYKLNGKTITFSFYWAHLGGTFPATPTIKYNFESGADNYIGIPTYASNGDKSITITLPTDAAQGDYFEFIFLINNSAGTISTLNVHLADIQLEEGSVATPFEQRPIGLESSLCQRYYWKGLPMLGINFGAYASNSFFSSSANFPNQMRVVPNMDSDFSSTTSTAIDTAYADNGFNVLQPTVNGFELITRSSGVNTNCNAVFNNSWISADAEIY